MAESSPPGSLSESQKKDAEADAFAKAALVDVRLSLHDFLIIRGWTQKRLIEESRLAKSTVCKALSGESKMQVRSLIKIARALKVPAAVLLMSPRLKVR